MHMNPQHLHAYESLFTGQGYVQYMYMLFYIPWCAIAALVVINRGIEATFTQKHFWLKTPNFVYGCTFHLHENIETHTKMFSVWKCYLKRKSFANAMSEMQTNAVLMLKTFLSAVVYKKNTCGLRKPLPTQLIVSTALETLYPFATFKSSLASPLLHTNLSSVFFFVGTLFDQIHV